VLARAKYSGRSDDNIESLKLRFDTYKEETLPTVDLFKSHNKCIEVDSGKDREAVYAQVLDALSEHTDQAMVDMPLTEKSEMLLGLRPFPNRS